MPATTTAPPASSVQWRGLALLCLAGVIWGTIGPGVDLAHEGSGMSPVVISAYRAIAAVVVLLGLSGLRGRLGTTWSIARSQWRRVVAVGVLTAAFQVLFFVSVVAAGVSVVTVVALGFAPVLLLVLGSVGRRRPPPAAQSLTVAVAVLGLLLVSLVGTGGDPVPHPVLGVLGALASGAAYALSAEVAAPLTRRLDTLTVTTATTTVAAAVLVPGGLLLSWARGDRMTSGDVGSWLVIVYLGVVTMALAYALLFTGLRSTPSGAAVIATLLEPVTAVVIAVAFLDERLTPAGLLGTLLVVAAIASLGRAPKEPPPVPQ